MWWDVSSLRLPLLTASLFIGSALAKGYYPGSKHPVWILIILFLIMALISTINGCVSYEEVTIIYVVTLVFVILMTERVLQSAKSLWGLVFVAAVSLGFFNSKQGLKAFFNGESLYDTPISRGSFSNTNASALGAGMSIYMLLFLISVIESGTTGNTPDWLSRKWMRVLTKIALYVILIGSIAFIFQTQSRGSALASILAMVVWTLFHPRKIRITAILCMVVAAILIVGVPESYQERISSAFAESSELERSAASRPHFWSTATRMAKSNLFGVGIGCYKTNYEYYDLSNGLYGSNRSVHSSHYSVLAEAGYPGFIVWIMLLLATFATLLRIRSRSSRLRLTDSEQDFYFKLSNALIASLTVFVSGGNFYEMAYNDFTWLIFAMTIAMSRLQKRVYR